MGNIIVTGAEGFIGSNLINYLNRKGIYNIIIVDSANNGYLKDAKYFKKITIEEFTLFCITETNDNIWPEGEKIDAIFHLGALVDTGSIDRRILDYNLTFSKILFDLCSLKNIPILYASSASVYGRSKTFKEDEKDLYPLNLYAKSKFLFDKYVLTYSLKRPDYWYGFRLFNVYGPNELHKEGMASAVTQIYLKAVQNGKITLFKSIEPDIRDGYQMRDYIHVKEVIRVMYYFYTKRINIPSGIYNLGSGESISFLKIAEHVNKSLGSKMKIRFVNTPKEIRSSYQSFTQADLQKTLKYIPFISKDQFEFSVQNHYNYLKRKKFRYYKNH